MSVQHIGWALGQPTGSATTKVVLVALANRVNPDNGLCCPSISRLVFETELSRSSVKRALDALEASGLVVRVRRQRENGSDTSNEYRFPYVTLSAGGLTVDPGPAQSGPPPRSTVNPPEPKERTQSRKDLAAAPRASSNAAKNEVWDKLVEMFGEPATQSEKTKRGKIVWSLVRAGASAAEIHKRAQTWPQHFGDVTLTETALEAHYTRLGRKPLRRR